MEALNGCGRDSGTPVSRQVRFEMSAPGRNRTCGLLLRRQTLYPLSYGGANSEAAPLGVHSVTHLQPVMDSGPEYPAP